MDGVGELEGLLERKEWILQMMNPYVYNRKCTAPLISRRLNQAMRVSLEEEEAWMDGVVLNNVDGSGGGVIDEEGVDVVIVDAVAVGEVVVDEEAVDSEDDEPCSCLSDIFVSQLFFVME